jgi:hypothetical protein
MRCIRLGNPNLTKISILKWSNKSLDLITYFSGNNDRFM